jgi:pyrroline-5-carboxylate reductase
MTNSQVCILGAGNMGRALLGGVLRAGTRAEHLSVAETLPAARAALLRELGISAAADAHAAVAGASVVVVAVKPQEARALLAGVAGALLRAQPLVISVVAGLRIATLQSWCPGVPVMRAMPNRPALIGAGASGLYAPAAITPAQRTLAAQVMSTVGEVAWVGAEEALDVVTALSGSGPAYFFLLAELMAEAGEQLGLEAATARRLATATLRGSGLMLQSADADLARLREQVTSPGGTTQAALEALERADLRGSVRSALTAATQRCRELAGGSSSPAGADLPLA